MSIGAGSSGQSSQPLNAQQRGDIFTGGVANIAQTAPGMFNANQSIGADGTPSTQYTMNAPAFQNPNYKQGMTTGDYSQMQQQMLKGGEAGLDYQLGNAEKNLNNDAAKRGVWSSGLVQQADKDLQAGFAPQYAAAGATAAGQAAQLSQSGAAAENAFNQTNAQNTYNSQWAPLNYLQGIYNQTGGAISNGSSDNFSI